MPPYLEGFDSVSSLLPALLPYWLLKPVNRQALGPTYLLRPGHGTHLISPLGPYRVILSHICGAITRGRG